MKTIFNFTYWDGSETRNDYEYLEALDGGAIDINRVYTIAEEFRKEEDSEGYPQYFRNRGYKLIPAGIIDIDI